jgi:YidC/Oxa1 family membrane protein insertase
MFLGTLLAAGPTTTVANSHKSGTSLLDPIAKPIAWVLAHIYAVIPNYGIAIIILSVLWMLIISPLTLKSTRSMLAMQKLQPQLKKLQEQHKNDRQAFAQAQMELFREHQVSPFGSCLPMLLPLPVFFALFRVITGLSHTVNGMAQPKYLSASTRMYHDIVASHGQLNAFGMNLSLNAFSHHSSVLAALPYWILLLVMAGTGYLQSAQMMSRNPAAAQNPQMRLMKYLPILFVIFFIRFPAGVLLYYAMSNICRIVQQDAMYRFDPKVKALVAQEVREVEAITHDIDEQGPDGGTGSSKRGGSGTSSGSGGAKGGAASGAAASGGRSRFRDLLAAASEQQQQRQRSKTPKPATGTGRNGAAQSGGKSTPQAGGNGSSSKNAPANGKTGSPSKPPARPSAGGQPRSGKSGSHRTNRKRRGR